MGIDAALSDHDGLFSLDISQHGGTSTSKILDASVENAELQGQRLSAFAYPTSRLESDLLHAVGEHKQVCTNSQGLNYSLLATLLSEEGYLVRTQAPQIECKCKIKSRKCLEKLAHTYLVCFGASCGPPMKAELIIEPRLKEHFEIAQPTECYKRLLSHLPSLYVGSASRLRTIVEAVSIAMAEAFKAQDMCLPPWRRTSAALSKWGLDDAGLEGKKGFLPVSSTGYTSKQPLKEQVHTDYNLPVFGSDVFAKASVSNSRRLVAGSPRHLSSGGAPGLENSLETSKPQVSLLARNLADMAALQKARRALEGSYSAKSKLKRAPSWDFTGLPPITTVRRSGKVM